MLLFLLQCPRKAWKEGHTSKSLTWHAVFLHTQLVENTQGFSKSDMGTVCTEGRHKNCPKAPAPHKYTISGRL